MKSLSISRGNQVLAGLLILQLIVVGLVFWPRSASEAAGEPLLAGLEVDQVTRVAIRDAEGREIVLAKVTGEWVLADAGDYPCLEDKVPEFLDKIAGIKSDRVVTQTRDSHARLQVAASDYVREVEIESADGTVHRFYLGSSPSYSAIHVRVEGQDQVYLVSGLTSSDANPSAATWVDTQYVSIPVEQVESVTLENANGTLEFKKHQEAWSLEGLAVGETADEAAISSLVSRLASVRMLRPLGALAQQEYGLESPNAVVVIVARDEGGEPRTHMLHVGSQSDEDGSYVLKFSESPYYVRVAEYTVKDWTENARDDFLEQPPTPTPSS